MNRMWFRRSARSASASSVYVLVLLLLSDDPLVAGVDGRVAWLAGRQAKSAATFAGSLRFQTAPDARQLGEIERLGILFGEHHSRTVYPAVIPFASLDTLERRRDVVHVDCAWHPGGQRPLAVSAPNVEADLVWSLPSPLGGTLSGEGVLICDFDSGIEVRHASFFDLSGERFVWLDVDADGQLSPGDAVDLDGNGRAGPGEALSHREATGSTRYGNVLGVYDADLDYLHNDRDQDDRWDQGPPDYGENDPCFGERLFLADDVNGNRRLDTGEDLLALGGSRIRTVMDVDGSIHRRGVDLLAADRDEYRHGTPVGGILCGGWPGRHRLTGIAPGADLLVIATDNVDGPMARWYEASLAWAVSEGADIVMYEWGDWIAHYLDGSSNLETMLSEIAADEGVIVVNAAGNLADGNMHAKFGSLRRQGLVVQADVSLVWVSFLWIGPSNLRLELRPPGARPLIVPADGSDMVIGDYRVFSNLSVSPRGTRRLDLVLEHDAVPGSLGGTWQFDFSGDETEIHGFFADDVSGWRSSSYWSYGLDASNTVTWPSTADSGIVVAAYEPYHEQDGVADFSGRGPRLDGKFLLDLAAPGGNISTADATKPHGYVNFGGTSAALPHVVGAAALLKELSPDLDHAACRRYLRAGAQRFPATEGVHDSGAGHLRIHQSVLALLGDMSRSGTRSGLAVATFPNPAPGTTSIRFLARAPGAARLRIFDLAGREVWTAESAAVESGWLTVDWNGSDASGRPVPAGVYFAHVKLGQSAGAVKLTRLR